MSARFAIVIPAYDAGRWVGDVLASCRAMNEAERLFERIVVVDDGSVDDTSAIAERGGADVLRHSRNLGKGAALRTGFGYALRHGVEGVVTLDADGQHLPSDAPRFVERWSRSGADLIIGSRSHLFDQMVPRRRLANQFSARSISVASGVELDDTQSGFRFYSRRFLNIVRFRSNGFSAESEMIVAAGLYGLRIETIPIELGFVDGLATSHYAAVRDTLRIAARVVVSALWYRLAR